jgi:hypothetical protein
MGTPSEIVSKHGSGERLVVKAGEGLARYLREHTKLRVESNGAGHVSVYLGNKKDALVALAAIDESGMEWSDLLTRRDSLEDIFLKLVGTEGLADEGEK